jgi:hypothetical protein
LGYGLIHLDDIVTWGTTLEKNNQRLVEVFDRMRVQSLKLEPDKCEFLRKELYFLVYKVTVTGVATDDRKMAAIKNYPVPKNKTVQGFCRFGRVLQKVHTAFQLDCQSFT